MKEDLIAFNNYKLLGLKGYDLPYEKSTHGMALKWLRVMRNIHIEPNFDPISKKYTVTIIRNDVESVMKFKPTSYEDAIDYGLTSVLHF